jgi:hypothetical protein
MDANEDHIRQLAALLIHPEELDDKNEKQKLCIA